MHAIDRSLLAHVTGGAGSSTSKQLLSTVTELRLMNTKLTAGADQGSGAPQPSPLMSQIPPKPSGTSLSGIPSQLGTIGAARGG